MWSTCKTQSICLLSISLAIWSFSSFLKMHLESWHITFVWLLTACDQCHVKCRLRSFSSFSLDIDWTLFMLQMESMGRITQVEYIQLSHLAWRKTRRLLVIFNIHIIPRLVLECEYRRKFIKYRNSLFWLFNRFKQGLKTEKLTCGVENGLNGVPWLGAFNWQNETSPLLGDGDNGADDGISCTLEEFQRFESFFLKFTTMSREYFLPPERQRFGLVSNRSLLSFLGVENLDTWSLMLHFKGCPNCSKILRKQEEIKSALLMHHTLAPEVHLLILLIGYHLFCCS